MIRFLRKRAARIACVVAVVVLLAPLLAASPAFADYPVTIYRFYNNVTATHFYTASAEEAAMVQAKWSSVFAYDGPAFTTWEGELSPEEAALRVPLYRFFNKQNGGHFYTISAEEADYVRGHYAATYTYEGVAFNVFSQPIWDLMPVYRFYNKANGAHFYTISENEKALVQLMWSATYKYEGIAFYADPGIYMGGPVPPPPQPLPLD
jgi:hypothetical protein